jgi:hypothetical protein
MPLKGGLNSRPILMKNKNCKNSNLNEQNNNHTPVDSAFYRKIVFDMFDSNASDRISNGSPMHAISIFEAMLSYATREVKIFCSKLATEVFGSDDVCDALENALKKGVRVRVVTQSTPDETKFKKILTENNLLIVSRDEEINAIEVNFAVMDDKAFRYEPKNSAIKAFACANDTSSASVLSNDFDEIIARTA